jgi:hypothetical protein
MSMWIADLERRFCDFLGIVPDDDDRAVIALGAVSTPVGVPDHGAADGEHKVARPLPTGEPSVPAAPRRPHMTAAGAGRARPTTHAPAAGPAVDAELGVLHQAVCELRAGLDADAS